MSTPALTKVAPDVEDEIATDPEESVEDVEKKTAEILALQAAEEKKKQANFWASSIQCNSTLNHNYWRSIS